jgi:hypothetical protein
MKRGILLLFVFAFVAAGCAAVNLRPDPACPDNLVLQNGEELPGRLAGMENGAFRYELLNGEMRLYPAADVLRVDLGRRVGDPHVAKLDDLRDKEIVAAVREAQKSPPDADYPTTVVFEERRSELTADHQVVTVWRRLLRINKEAGLGAANDSFSYNSLTSSARTDFGYAIAPDGAVAVLSAGSVRDSSLGDGSPDGSQSRTVQIAVPGARPGGFVYYQFSTREKLDGLRQFGREYTAAYVAPLQHYREIIRTPRATPLRVYERNFDATVTKTDRIDGGDRVIVYEVKNPPIRQPEPMMPSWNVVAPFYVVTAADQWPAIAATYEKALAPRLAADEKVAAKARELTAGKTGRAAAEALYRFALRDVRDTGVYMWDRDPLPKPPAQTLAEQRGNQVDRTALLYAMAKAVGLSADWLLAGGWQAHWPFAETPLLPRLNAVILRFDFGAGPVWCELSGADQVFGQLPDYASGAFFLDAAHGATGVTPPQGPQINHALNRYDVQLAADGGARIVEEQVLSGNSAQWVRDMRRLTDKQLHDRMASAVRNVAPRNQLVEFSIDGMQDLRDPVTVRLVSQCPLLTIAGGGRYQMLRLFNVQAGEMNRVNPQRQYPLEVEGPSWNQFEYRFHLPPGITVKQLPPPLDAPSPWGRTRGGWTLQGDLLTFTLEIVVDKLDMPAADFEKQQEYLRLRRELVDKPVLLEPAR